MLVIDDEPDIRELLDLTLSRMGLEVTTAEDLGEARRALQANKFSFCLTDMRLPDGNGLDLVEEISERYPESAHRRDHRPRKNRRRRLCPENGCL